MFGIGMPEMILILAVALIVIGPKKLPDLAKSLGKAMGEFKKATSDLKESMQIDTELRDVKTAFDELGKDEPQTDPTIADSEEEPVAGLADEMPESAPQDPNGDAMDPSKAAFKHPSEADRQAAAGDTQGGDEPASESDSDADTRKE
jgi:sec-independent protein translocase protein TatB